MTLMTTMIAAYYPLPMEDSRINHCRSAGSHKRRGQSLGCASNAAKLDTQGAPVAVPVPTLIPDVVQVEDLLDESYVPGGSST